jgi:hypothetical protein
METGVKTRLKTTELVTNSSQLTKIIESTLAFCTNYARSQQWQIINSKTFVPQPQEVEKTLFGTSLNKRKKAYKICTSLNKTITLQKVNKFLKKYAELSSHAFGLTYRFSMEEENIIAERVKFKKEKEFFITALARYTNTRKNFKQSKKQFIDSGKLFTR